MLALILVVAAAGGAGSSALAQTATTPLVSSTGPFTVAEGSVKVAQMTASGFSEDAEDLFWSILAEADSGADGDNVYVVTVKVSNVRDCPTSASKLSVTDVFVDSDGVEGTDIGPG